MGLDMYLTRKYHHSNAEGTVILQEEEIGYWRKANAIHAWFVDNIQKGMDDQEVYEVTLDQLHTLLTLVKTVLAHPEKAPDLLPTREGFFFGGTDYDEWYFDGLRDTVKIIEDAIAAHFGEAHYYYSCWW